MTRGWCSRLWAFLRTIRVRLTLWYVALLAVILITFGAFLYVSLSRALHNELERSLTASSDQLAAAFLTGGRPGLVQAIGTLPPGTVAILYDARGQQLFANSLREPLAPVVQALVGAAQRNTTFDAVGLPGGGRWGVLTGPIVIGGQPVAILQVARSKQDIDVALHHLILLMAIAIPVILLVAVGGGLFLASRALGPIDRITRTVGSIEADNLSQRVGYRSSRDEVGRLAATFDAMLDRVQGAFQKQREFTADASHELRTPLAILTSQIDVALERERTAREYEDVLGSLREDTSRMSQLVTQMLTLARADAGQEVLSRESVDLREMAEHVVFAMQPLAEQRQVRLSADTSAPVLVDGDQTRLMQLIVNLVDNGLRYTPAGGSVTVSALAEDGHGVLRVADTGVGIAREHLPRLFERFYRVDKARARAEGGTGLGLSICRWIVQAHGGTIDVESEPGRGSIFTARIPLAGAHNPAR